MIKICYVTTISLTLKAFVLEIAKYLHEKEGWDISFICSEDEEFARMLPEYIHYYPVHMERGISVAGIKAMVKIHTICKREKFDLVQYSTPNASLYAAIATKMAKVPQRLYCQWGMAYVGFTGIKRKVFKLEEKVVCALSTWIEPDSKSNLQFAHREGLYPANKGSVIWNGSACGVNMRKFDFNKKSEYRKKIRDKYGIPEDAFVFGFVGRMNGDKGVNELFTATRRLFKHNPNLYLLLVGGKDSAGRINELLLAWARNSDRVIFTGFTEVVEEYLSAMDCYILPSYREGFGMGVIEAEAMGVPVIVTNIPGPTDAMLDGITGVIVRKADVSSLQKAMSRIMKKEIHITERVGVDFTQAFFEQQELFERIRTDRKKLLHIQ